MSDTLEKNTPLITSVNLPPNMASAALGGTLSVVAVGGGSNNGSFLSSAGSNGVSWAPSPSYTISSLSNTTLNVGPTVTKITTPLEVNGRDILKELDEMRDALLLLKRDVKMEEKYPKLKELKDAYERALEKYKTFDAIKDSK